MVSGMDEGRTYRASIGHAVGNGIEDVVIDTSTDNITGTAGTLDNRQVHEQDQPKECVYTPLR